MAMALAPVQRLRLSELISDGVKYFMEKLLVQIYEHFDEQDLTDVTFKLANPTAFVTAHRLILSSASPYLKKLFKSEEGISPLIELNGIDSDTFERLITFCYTGHALITMDNVELMLKASLKLQLNDAIADCVDFLINHINDYTLKRLYSLHDETQCDMLKQKILEYELENFTRIVHNSDFLTFEANKLQALLVSDDLNVGNEKEAFAAVKRWYEHDPPARRHHLPDVISCLRLNQFDTNFLLEYIHPLPGCEIIALKAVSWSNAPSSRAKISLRFPNPRTAQTETAFLALRIGGGKSRTIFQYNKTDDSWLKWFDIKIDVSFSRVVLMDDNLIFIGGERNGKRINEVKSWNLKTKKFKQMQSMNESRSMHCVALLNDEIYAIGGCGADGKTLKSVEKYTESNGWKSVKGMVTPRSYSDAVTLNGKIYVPGGHNGKRCLKTVEYYDPKTNCWSQCSDLNEARANIGLTVHNGKIFAVGGWNEVNSPVVECCDPKKRGWTKIGSLDSALGLIGTISIDDQLWAVGGNNEVDKDCVSVYDEVNDKWIKKKSIPVPGYYYCFSVPKPVLQNEKKKNKWHSPYMLT